MKRLLKNALASLLTLLVVPATSQAHPAKAPASLQRNVTPKGFIPNVGQTANDAVKFTIRDGGVTGYLTKTGFVLANGQTVSVTKDGMLMEVPVAPRWELLGARPVEPVGRDTYQHTVSYFKGKDPANWHPNVPAFREVSYPEIAPGVEMRFTSGDNGFEYSFHVQPGAKPELRFRYNGITALEKSLLGDLTVRTAKGHFTESKPVAFQYINGARQMVESSFEILSANEYRILVGSYEREHELVIDPVLDWSTFLGGTYSVNMRDVKVAPDGKLCVVGGTTSVDLPDTAGFNTGPGVTFSNNQFIQDVFAAQFNSTGTQLLWLGYLAGAGATEDSVGYGQSLALDNSGNLHIVGFTASPDFPVTGGSSHAGGSDVFVTKISSDGSAILRSSFLGGTGDDYGWGITLDAQQNVLLTGFTRSGNFPVNAFDTTLGGAQDAFVARLDPSGAIQWSAFLGGANGVERGAAILADANGDILVTGDTQSSDFPVTAGALSTTLGGADDAFVTKIRADGSSILWATFVGGSGLEHSLEEAVSQVTYPRGDLALDSAGNIVIAGHTLSSDFPVTSGAFQTVLAGDMDGYVAKLTPDGTSLIWASYLGGSGGDQYQEIIWGITVNPWDEVFLIGRTDSPNFPVTPDALLTSYPGGLQDGFLTKLTADGSSVLYSTYLGGSQNRDVALGLTYDAGNVFVSGWGASPSYPVTADAYQTDCSGCDLGHADGVLLKFTDAYLAYDGFESANYSGGSGWAGGWSASGDLSILTSSGPHSGNRHVRLRRGTGLLRRNLAVPPGSDTLTLGFWSKVASFEGSDRADVTVTATGIPAVSLSLTAAHSDGRYHYYEINLASFVSASQIQVTFDAVMSGTDDQWYLDDIRVSGTQIAGANQVPIANAGPNQTVTDTDRNGSQPVVLNGSASTDPDGTIESYSWSEGGVFLGTGATINGTFAIGVHTVTLTVTDNGGASATDIVVIEVKKMKGQ